MPVKNPDPDGMTPLVAKLDVVAVIAPPEGGNERTDVAWLPEVIVSVVVHAPEMFVAVGVTLVTAMSSMAI